MADWRVFPIDDKDVLRRFLSQDRKLAAYALGDLAPPHWDYARFFGAEVNGDLRALAFFYDGVPGVTNFQYFGAPQVLPAMRDVIVGVGRVHYMLQPEAHHALKAWYKPIAPRPMWRMVVPPDRFIPHDTAKAERLGPADLPALRALFGARVDVFGGALIEDGVFYSVRDPAAGRAIVALAGTHIVAPSENIAALGYVYTAPHHRSKGYATICTAAVTRTLLDMGIGTVILNVAQDNAPAIKVYERLGYQTYCPLVEGTGMPR